MGASSPKEEEGNTFNQNSDQSKKGTKKKKSSINPNSNSNIKDNSKNKKDSNTKNNNEISEDELSEPSLITKKIQNFKRIDPGEILDNKPKTKEEKNEQKLIEAIENDDYDENNDAQHEYMFFPMKDGPKQQNIEPLLKKSKKKKQMYTFTKDKDKKKENELAKILHINYDTKKPKYPYSIQKLKTDKPDRKNDYLVIEYNMNKIPKEKREGNKKYELISRTVHTNYKDCDLDNYDFTKHNGERYDYLEMNNDTNQIRRLELMKKKGIKVIWGNNLNDKEKEDEDENNKNDEKKIKEKEENEDRYNNKFKKGQFTIKKMY